PYQCNDATDLHRKYRGDAAEMDFKSITRLGLAAGSHPVAAWAATDRAARVVAHALNQTINVAGVVLTWLAIPLWSGGSWLTWCFGGGAAGICALIRVIRLAGGLHAHRDGATTPALPAAASCS
ncbi:MAG: hypothetical protein ACRDTV_10555, partial [Mycobacterium sp.]